MEQQYQTLAQYIENLRPARQRYATQYALWLWAGEAGKPPVVAPLEHGSAAMLRSVLRAFHARWRRTGQVVVLIACGLLSGCAAQYAAYDDAQCRSYGARKGDPAYVQCRTALGTTRTLRSPVDDILANTGPR